jgi:DNA-binding NarL/FixJ family response regulator
LPDVAANTALRAQRAAMEVILPRGPQVSFADIAKRFRVSLEQLEWTVERERRRRSVTKREREVLIAYADGAQHKEIAEMLGITEKTSRCYMQRCSKKLDIRNRVLALHYCILANWIEPGVGLSDVARASAEKYRQVDRVKETA